MTSVETSAVQSISHRCDANAERHLNCQSAQTHDVSSSHVASPAAILNVYRRAHARKERRRTDGRTGGRGALKKSKREATGHQQRSQQCDEALEFSTNHRFPTSARLMNSPSEAGGNLRIDRSHDRASQQPIRPSQVETSRVKSRQSGGTRTAGSINR